MLQPLIALALGDKSVSFGIRLFDSHAASVHPLFAYRVNDDGESEPLLAQQEQYHEEGGEELEQQIKTGQPDLRREIESARQRLFTAAAQWPRCTAWPWTTPLPCMRRLFSSEQSVPSPPSASRALKVAAPHGASC
jgi:hypothetical protein